MTTLVWFRDDLRLADHPALLEASRDPGGVVCAYVLDEESDGMRPLGDAARWWLHHSLVALANALGARGIPLVLRRGRAAEQIGRLATEAGASTVVWNRRYGLERLVDAELKQALRARGLEVRSFPGGVLHEPWTVATRAGTPFRVYTPFWLAIRSLPVAPPLPAPTRLVGAASQPDSEAIDALHLRSSTPDPAAGLAERWTPGEAAARTALAAFLADRLELYAVDRDRPALDGTSELSPRLRWGELSPRTVWHGALVRGAGSESYLRELGWREFAWHTLHHEPALATRNLDRRFDRFPWAAPDPDELHAWREGSTGIPLVDAGMRELRRTGTMHGRVRMVAASFLTKNLLIDWRVGERWFWDALVDADPASNPFNWQWVAGCGADAAPYFRVFNPDRQAQRFDPDGAYVARWAPDSRLVQPIVDLALTRRRALAAYDRIRAR